MRIHWLQSYRHTQYQKLCRDLGNVLTSFVTQKHHLHNWKHHDISIHHLLDPLIQKLLLDRPSLSSRLPLVSRAPLLCKTQSSLFHDDYGSFLERNPLMNDSNSIDLFAWAYRDVYPEGNITYQVNESPCFGLAFQNHSWGGTNIKSLYCLGVYICPEQTCHHQIFQSIQWDKNGAMDLYQTHILIHIVKSTLLNQFI